VEVGPNVQLTDCILGRRCKMEGGEAKEGDKTVLKDCEVQDGQVVEWGSKYHRFLEVEGQVLTKPQPRRRTRSSCGLTWGMMLRVKVLPAMRWMRLGMMREVYLCVDQSR
jgi:hypothetical protein